MFLIGKSSVRPRVSFFSCGVKYEIFDTKNRTETEISFPPFDIFIYQRVFYRDSVLRYCAIKMNDTEGEKGGFLRVATRT